MDTDSRFPKRIDAFMHRYGLWLITGLGIILTVAWLGLRPSLLQYAPALTAHVNSLRQDLTALEVERSRLERFNLVRPDKVQWLARDMRLHIRQFQEKTRQAGLVDVSQTLHALQARLQHLLHTFDGALREHAIVVDSYNTLPVLGESCELDLRKGASPPATLHPHDIYTALLLLPLRRALTEQEIQAVTTSVNRARTILPSDSQACGRFIEHARTFIRHFARLHQQLNRLNLDSARQLISRLDTQLQHHIAVAQQRQRTLSVTLAGLGGVMALLIFIMMALLKRTVTTLRQQKQELTRTSRLYHALSDINEIIVTEKNERTLLQRALEILVNDLQIPGGVVTCCPDANNILTTVAVHTQSQEARQLLEQFKFDISPGTGNATATMLPAWESQDIQIFRDLNTHPRFARWHSLLRRFSIRHVITLPLVDSDGNSRYLITLYMSTDEYAGTATLQLLREVREDLELALHRLHLLQKERQQAALLRLAEVAFNAHEGIVIANEEGRIERANDTLLHWCGLDPEHMADQTLSALFVEQSVIQRVMQELPHSGYWQGELSLRHVDGTPLPTLTTLTWVPPSQETDRTGHFIAHCLNLSRQRQLEHELRSIQQRDPVTGLPNHKALIDQLSTIMEQIMPHGECGIISIINIRGFKSINTALGHQGGDTLLRQLAERLRERPAFPHLTARSSNDEFLLVPIHFFSSPDAARQWWERKYAELLGTLSEPYDINGQPVQVEYYASAMLFDHDLPAERIVDEIETGIQLARQHGQGVTQLYFHTPDQTSDSRQGQDITLRHQLEQALERGELVLFHQPVHNTLERRFTLTEALIRWRRDGELVPPGAFIPVLERYPQLMTRVGRWVLRQGIADAARLNRILSHPVSVSVNLSAVQFNDTDLIAILKEALTRHKLPPAQLTLEITESALMADLGRTRALLDALRELGVHVAIDDFGTGYASLQYLQLFQPDKLKLDKSFIDPIDPQDRRTLAIPEATVAMAHALGAKVVAEGVETAEQAAALSAIGCELLQGYHFARPMPLDALLDFLKQSETQ